MPWLWCGDVPSIQIQRAQKKAMNWRCAHAETDAMGAESSLHIPSTVGMKCMDGEPFSMSCTPAWKSPGNSSSNDSGVQEVTSSIVYNTASGMRQRALFRRIFVRLARGKNAICKVEARYHQHRCAGHVHQPIALSTGVRGEREGYQYIEWPWVRGDNPMY